MCHLALLLPVVGLGVFWLLPPPAAVIAYLIILGASALLYKAVLDAMRREVQTGAETLLGATAHVTYEGPGGLIVQVRGTLWKARTLGPKGYHWSRGERARVIGRHGNTLAVTPLTEHTHAMERTPT